MSVVEEKAEVLKKLEAVEDILLLRAIRNMLDFGLKKQETDNSALNESIKRGLEESERSEVLEHNQVMQKIRERYKT